MGKEKAIINQEAIIDEIIRIFYPKYEELPKSLVEKMQNRVKEILRKYFYDLVPEELDIERDFIFHPDYIEGFNACRKEVLKNMKTFLGKKFLEEVEEDGEEM